MEQREYLDRQYHHPSYRPPMKRADRVAVMGAAIVGLLLFGSLLLLASSCASQGNALDRAKLAYVDASIAYEGAQQAVVLARSHHQVSDAQWAQFDVLQHRVAVTVPTVKSLLMSWSASGTKPATWDEQFTAFLILVEQATAAKQKVGGQP